MLQEFFFILFLVSCSNCLPLSDFFPFGSQVNDSIIDQYTDYEGPILLPYGFTYFDNSYKEIWIIRNGLFSSIQLNSYAPPQSWSSLNNSLIVAGFWHENIWYPANDTGNIIYYQIYHNEVVSNGARLVFNKASDYVRQFFPQQRPFKPKMVITGTWYYLGVMNNGHDTLNNTFQIVLTTDEDRSFIFFLYHDLQWANPYNNSYYYARAGFHNGNRNVSEQLPNSGTEDVVELSNESNVNTPGLFAFRVDAETIHAGGCHANTSLISFRPRTSSQLGSTAITIYGPCFTNQTKVKCQFGSSSSIVDGFIADEFRAICLTPFASEHGPVPVNVSIDNGRTFISAGTLALTPLKFGSDEVIIETESNDNLLHVGQYIKLRWIFSEVIRNSFPNGAKISIELWKVSRNFQSPLQIDNAPIVLAQNMNLTNSIRVQLPASISNITSCFIRVVVKFNTQTYTGLNTGLLVVRNHPTLARDLCRSWALQQPEPSTWNENDLLPCPMTRRQVIVAGRCCYVPDRQCSRLNLNANNCRLHQARSGRNESSAVECYVSITSNRHGAEAECCYDAAGTIITRGTGAGTDNRYGQTKSPVQHFFYDTLPYLQCCMMNTSIEECNLYMYYRPPRRGSNTMGENGRMWGDPHFGTLDGNSYTFNGYGEYIYLAISNATSPSAAFNSNSSSFIFMSQVRTGPIASSEATVTKAFAARTNRIDDQSISVTISRREQLVIRRGDEILEFEDNIDSFFFPGMAIARIDSNMNGTSNFRISWSIGVTIEISVIQISSPSKQLVLNVAASVAGIFRGKTYGLLGTYDGIASNDLRSKNGSIISSNATIEQIHKDFGITWAIDPTSSLFYYESNQSAQFFEQMNRAYLPSFIDPLLTNNSTFREVCDIDATSLPSSWDMAQRTCYYDLSKTNDANFAEASLIASKNVFWDRTFQTNPPSFNSALPIRMNLRHDDQINLNLSASSEYPSHIVELIAIVTPANSTLNQTTGIFTWKAIKGEHYLSIRARDKNSTLTSKHDIDFNVKANDDININSTTKRITATTTARRSASNNLVQEVMIIISMLGLEIILH
ncbi:unnamed protein product [Rotaria magnacalcarata]|nr:unnamed protein product [Rotaria magnacalcarata]